LPNCPHRPFLKLASFWLLSLGAALALTALAYSQAPPLVVLGIVGGMASMLASFVVVHERVRRQVARLRETLARAGRQVAVIEVCTATGQVIWVSATAAALLGIAPEDTVGQPLESLRPAWAAGQARRLLVDGSSRSEIVLEHTEPWLRGDGELLWADAVAAGLADGDPATTFIVLQDVTERRGLQEALARQTERLQQLCADLEQSRSRERHSRELADCLLRDAPPALLLVDPHTLIIQRASSRATELTGYPLDCLLGRPLAALGLWGSLAPASSALPGPVEDLPQVCELTRADGTSLSVQVTTRPVGAGSRRTHAVILRDRERLDRGLDEHRRLQERVRELESAQDHLRTALQARSEALASTSHELRTPLNAIVGFSELLKSSADDRLDDRQRQFIADIRRSSEHLLSLVNDVLDLSRAEAGKLDLVLVPVPVAPLLQSVAAVARALAEPRRIHLTCEVGADASGAWADENRAKQVLLNLVTNAVRHSPEGGRVVLSAERRGPRVHFAVRDEGPGIAPEYHERIFERFFRIPPAGPGEPAAPGSGLGLPLSLQLVRAMGSELTVDSAPGAGSVFGFSLAAYDPAPAEQPAAPQHLPREA
jgi:PAS domain S-box-containing protein